MKCPNLDCGAEVSCRHAFCTHCGQDLKNGDAPPTEPTEALCTCGARGLETIDQGFCTNCQAQRVPTVHNGRDHDEQRINTIVGATTDIGKKHFRNEDAFALGEQAQVKVAVVSDGVSNSADGDQASSMGSATACNYLLNGIRDGRLDYEALMTDAINAAQKEVRAIPYRNLDPQRPKDPPEATLMAAMVLGRKVISGWLGDSRAYFVGKQDTYMLTRDHSFIVELLVPAMNLGPCDPTAIQLLTVGAAIDPKKLAQKVTIDFGDGHAPVSQTLEQWLKSRDAHGITQCLGGGAGGDVPSVRTFLAPEPGRLILCTDGLWNYVGEPREFGKLVCKLATQDAMFLSRSLIKYACERGGKDNITVAVINVD